VGGNEAVAEYPLKSSFKGEVNDSLRFIFLIRFGLWCGIFGVGLADEELAVFLE
jgi:hypothetical protein